MTPQSKPPAITFHTRTAGLPAAQAGLRIVWAHGWGHTGHAFDAMVASLATQAHHLILDFPGFGGSPLPQDVWGTADYADATAAVLPPFAGPTLWVGHSFGCRVALQMAARHPQLVQGFCLIAGAGLPRTRPLAEKLWFKTKIYTFKTLKHIWLALGRDVAPLRAKFGSADYRNAGPLRNIFVKTVSENLTEEARKVTVPTLLIYGEKDTETPPEIGTRLNALIPGSTLVVLPGQTHYSLLAEGRHATLKHLSQFIKKIG